MFHGQCNYNVSKKLTTPNLVLWSVWGKFHSCGRIRTTQMLGSQRWWRHWCYQENYSQTVHIHTFSIREISGTRRGQCFECVQIYVLLYQPINACTPNLNSWPCSFSTACHIILYCKWTYINVLVDVVHIRPGNKSPVKQNYKMSVFTEVKWLLLKILGNEFTTKQNTGNRSHNMVAISSQWNRREIIKVFFNNFIK